MKNEQGAAGVIKWLKISGWDRSQVSADLPRFCLRMVKEAYSSSSSSFYLPLTLIVVSLFSLQCMIHRMVAGRREGTERVEGLQLRTGIELLSAQTMARYGPCIFRNWMMKEGPPATIWGGRWLRGQFSMLMMDSLLQRASSNGRLCRLGLSLRYSSSKFSSVPENRCQRLLNFILQLMQSL